MPGSTTPILVLTARASVQDRVSSFDLVADGYLTKPFEMDELLARIRSLVRPNRGRSNPLLKLRDIEFDPKENTVRQFCELVYTGAGAVLLEAYAG